MPFRFPPASHRLRRRPPPRHRVRAPSASPGRRLPHPFWLHSTLSHCQPAVYARFCYSFRPLLRASFCPLSSPPAFLLVGLSNAPAQRLGNALADRMAAFFRPSAGAVRRRTASATLSVTAAGPSPSMLRAPTSCSPLSAARRDAPLVFPRPSDWRVAVARLGDGDPATPTALQHEEPVALGSPHFVASRL